MAIISVGVVHPLVRWLAWTPDGGAPVWLPLNISSNADFTDLGMYVLVYLCLFLRSGHF